MSTERFGIRISGPLAGFAEGYGAELTQLGYAPASVRLQLKVLADRSDCLLSRGMAAADLRRSDLERFLRRRRPAGSTRYASIRAVRPLLDYLQRFEVVPRRALDAVLDPVDVMLDRFWRYLTVERALAAVTARACLHMVRPFVQGRLSADRQALNLERLTAADIISFVVTRCPRQSRGAAKLTVTALRSFLRFLHLDGVIDEPLALCRAIGCRPAIGRAAEWVGSRPGSTPFRLMRRHHAARLPGHRHSDHVGPSRYAVGRSSQANLLQGIERSKAVDAPVRQSSDLLQVLANAEVMARPDHTRSASRVVAAPGCAKCRQSEGPAQFHHGARLRQHPISGAEHLLASP